MPSRFSHQQKFPEQKNKARWNNTKHTKRYRKNYVICTTLLLRKYIEHLCIYFSLIPIYRYIKMIIIKKQCNKFWGGWRQGAQEIHTQHNENICYPSTILNECYNFIIISDFFVSKICPCGNYQGMDNCWYYIVTEYVSICFTINTDILLILFPITVCEVSQFLEELIASRFMSLFFPYPQTQRTTKRYKKS